MPPTGTQRRRMLAALYLALGVVLALVVRTSFVMLVRGPALAKSGRAVRVRAIPVGAPRGEIVTADGVVLAGSQTTYRLYAVPRQVKDKEGVAREVAEIVGQSAEHLQALLQRRVTFVWLARRLDAAQVVRVRALRVAGLGLAPQAKRVYPNGLLAGAVLGFSGIDNQGLEGIERSYDGTLRGKDGAIGIEMDAYNQPVAQPRVTYTPPKSGDELVLTLRADVQRIAMEAAETARRDTSARLVSVMVLDVKTGGILGMALDPSYDPSDFAAYTAAQRRNPAVSDVLPPGSTFKAITAAAALAQGVVTPASGFYDPGFVRVDGVPLRCWKRSGHGAIDFTGVVAHSCNVGFVEVGLRLGTNNFYNYLKKFRVLGVTGIDLPGEARSIVPPKARVKPIDLATMAFGQTLALTPVSLLAAIGAIADGGVWHQPHLMQEIVSPGGKTLETWHGVSERIVPESAARTAVELLEGVVREGSGRPAQIPGYDLAGKTGTAQAVINGHYVEGKYISSFVGFGPAKAPQVAMLVQIFEPVGPYYGGQIAAPVVGRAMAQVLAALKIPPDAAPPKALPDLAGMTGSSAAQALKGLGLSSSLIGPGTKVTSQFPPAGAAVQPGSRILVYLGRGAEVAVPELVGLKVDAAAQALDRVGLRLRVSGEGTVVDQVPRPGAKLPLGGTVWVEAKPPEGTRNM